MDPITCPHANCGYVWTPRKENPKKCPQCQGPRWQSPRPKRKTISQRVEPVVFKVAGEEGSPVQIPASPQPVFIDERRAKAEELFRKLA